MELSEIEPGRRVEIDYMNHRGERALRIIEPTGIRFGANDYHTGRQWLLDGLDVASGQGRSFAMADIHGWRPLLEEEDDRVE